MDIATLLAGGGLVAAGAVLQRVLPAPRRNRKQLRQPICGCKHHRSFHEEGTGACSKISGWDDKQCRCQIYSGPITLAEISAQDFPAG